MSVAVQKDLQTAFRVSISEAEILQTRWEDTLFVRSTLTPGEQENILLAQSPAIAEAQIVQVAAFPFVGV